MGSIDFKSITDKVAAWSKSDEGKERIQKVITGYIKRGVQRTEAGSEILSTRTVHTYANELIEMVREYAESHDIPASVIAHFDSLKISDIHQLDDGSFAVEIRFTDDLSRPSLEKAKYGGVENIIAIFNNGYPEDASRSVAIEGVRGYWHGKEIHALGYRPGLHFMQDAIADFNLIHKKDGFVSAELAEIYKQ